MSENLPTRDQPHGGISSTRKGDWEIVANGHYRGYATSAMQASEEVKRLARYPGITEIVVRREDKSPVVRTQQQQKVEWLDELLTLYDNAGAVKWLTSPHKLLDGMMALDAIRAGRQEDVARIVEQLTTGAFI